MPKTANRTRRAPSVKLASVDLEAVPEGVVDFMGMEMATGTVGEEKFSITASLQGVLITGKHQRYGIRWEAIMEGVARAMEAELQQMDTKP